MATSEAAGAGVFESVGGRLSLDFLNTVGWREDAGTEQLRRYADLVAWGQAVGLLSGKEAESLRAEAEARPEEAGRVLKRALELREAVYRVVTSLVRGGTPTSADLGVLEGAVVRAAKQCRLVPDTGGCRWTWERLATDLDGLLAPVADDAAELLTSEALGRVRQCGGADCDWLFLDTSRNRSRRWCDMRGCGNRAKARRHYARVRRASSSS